MSLTPDVESIGYIVVVTAWVCPAITLPIFGLRLYAALRVLKRWHCDDCESRFHPPRLPRLRHRLTMTISSYDRACSGSSRQSCFWLAIELIMAPPQIFALSNSVVGSIRTFGLETICLPLHQDTC